MITPRYGIGEALARLAQQFNRVIVTDLRVHCFHSGEDEPVVSVGPAAYKKDKASLSFSGAVLLDEVQAAVAYAEAYERLMQPKETR